MKRLRRKGFTLVEIMIVVAIIALLAAIAIPNLLRARHNANEAAAQATLKTMSTGLESYLSVHADTGYPTSIVVLGTETPPYLDTTIAQNAFIRQGYSYTYAPGATEYEYTVTAAPVRVGITGTRTFTIDESGVITAT